MAEPLLVARSGAIDVALLPQLANRHGLITGATGTGKTVSLQVLAERFATIGVPVFMADVKGDLSGLGAAGTLSPKLDERLRSLKIEDWQPQAFTAVFWDVFGAAGHPVRATVSDMGPLLLGRLLGLNETQAGVLQIIFRIADDNGLLLLDLKDLRTMTQYVGDRAAEFRTQYGNVSAASVGAVQRGLLSLEEQGGDSFFGEPMLDIADLMQTDDQGRGVINILAADRLMNSPRLYSTFLLWLLAELFEQLPEVGDVDKPKLVFFFDEAHLLFAEAPPALLQKIEQVVRLVRSKGVGVYFVSQNPLDIPDTVLGQLGNRVQHALRAFTPRDQKAVKTAAETLRANPAFSAETVISELGVGEALVSFLDAKGRPQVVERVFILPPASRIGPLSAGERQAAIERSLVYGHYEKTVDRESAFEKLGGAPAGDPAAAAPAEAGGGLLGGLGDMLGGMFGGGATPAGRAGSRPAAGRAPESIGGALAKSAARAIGSSVGREIVRGVLGSILGGRRR